MVDVNSVASEIVESSLKSLSSEFSYFAYPLGMLNLDIGEVENIAVVGDKALIAPFFVLETTASGGVKRVFSSILHVLMHCLFCTLIRGRKTIKDTTLLVILRWGIS